MVGTFHSTKNHQNFKMGTKGEEIYWESIQKSENCWSSEKWTIYAKTLRKSQKEGKFAVNNFFGRFLYTSLPQSKGCPLFWKFWKCFHILEISRIENWNFWLNEQHPLFFFNYTGDQSYSIIDNWIFRQEPSNWQGFKLTPMLYPVFQCHNMPFNLGILGQCRNNNVRHQPHWRLLWLYVVSALFSNKSY